MIRIYTCKQKKNNCFAVWNGKISIKNEIKNFMEKGIVQIIHEVYLVLIK